MVNISTNINKTNNYLKSQLLITRKTPQNMTLEQAQKCGWIKPVNEIPIFIRNYDMP